MIYYPVYKKNTPEFIGIYKRNEPLICPTIEFHFCPARSNEDCEKFDEIHHKIRDDIQNNTHKTTLEELKYFHEFNTFQIEKHNIENITIFLIDFKHMHPDAIDAARQFFSFTLPNFPK